MRRITGPSYAAGIVTLACLLITAVPALAQSPLRVGDEFPIRIDSRGPSDVESTTTPTGRAFRLSHDGATYIALHFAEMDLQPGTSLRISDGEGGQSYLLRGRGKMEAGEFWSQHVKGDTVVLEYEARNPGRNGGFLVDRYAAGFVDLGGPEAICGTDDKDNAICYESSHPTEYGRSRAVARLLIQGSSLCTGWLASASNHLVTNEHCISSATAALNTDYEFMSEAPTCGSGNCQLCWAGTVFSGASFLKDSPALDYALVQITSGDPASTYGFLTIDDRAAVTGEEIYIPQHPGGRAKELGIFSSDPADTGGVCRVGGFAPGCSSASYQDVGYQCDTEGGSSGSPVLARSSHQVIALHHCANCPNRGVPINLVCDEICGFLGPECVVDGDCNDGNDCTVDTCVAGSCQNDPVAGPCCGDGSCDLGEDCNTCGIDCPSGGGGGGACGDGVCDPASEDCLTCAVDCNGKQNGKPANRFCCGDGGGENPVGCGDSRCTSGGFDCGTPPPPWCCGQAGCEAGEDSQNCPLDCPPPVCGDASCDPGEDACNCSLDCGAPDPTETNCSDGIDNDCNGLTDGDDPACQSCGGKNAACSSNADCCSGSCKPNGRCR